MAKVKVQFYVEEKNLKLIDHFLQGSPFGRAQFFTMVANQQAQEIEEFNAPDPLLDNPNVDWSKTEKEVKDYRFFQDFALQCVEYQRSGKPTKKEKK